MATEVASFPIKDSDFPILNVNAYQRVASHKFGTVELDHRRVIDDLWQLSPQRSCARNHLGFIRMENTNSN